MSGGLSNASARPWLRLADAERPVCSVGAIAQTVRSGPFEDRLRQVQLTVFGLWIDAAFLPNGQSLSPDSWTRLIRLDLGRLADRLGLRRQDVEMGVEAGVSCGLIKRRPRLDEVELTTQCFESDNGVASAVDWGQALGRLQGAPAAISALRGAVHLLKHASEPGRIPMDALAKVAGYSPNAIREGLHTAIERGLLVPGIAIGPRRTYGLTNFALGRDATPAPDGRSASTVASGNNPHAMSRDTDRVAAVEIGGMAMKIPVGVDVTIRVEGMEKSVTIRVGS